MIKAESNKGLDGRRLVNSAPISNEVLTILREKGGFPATDNFVFELANGKRVEGYVFNVNGTYKLETLNNPDISQEDLNQLANNPTKIYHREHSYLFRMKALKELDWYHENSPLKDCEAVAYGMVDISSFKDPESSLPLLEGQVVQLKYNTPEDKTEQIRRGKLVYTASSSQSEPKLMLVDRINHVLLDLSDPVNEITSIQVFKPYRQLGGPFREINGEEQAYGDLYSGAEKFKQVFPSGSEIRIPIKGFKRKQDRWNKSDEADEVISVELNARIKNYYQLDNKTGPGDSYVVLEEIDSGVVAAIKVSELIKISQTSGPIETIKYNANSAKASMPYEATSGVSALQVQGKTDYKIFQHFVYEGVVWEKALTPSTK